jgi:hypothetical protein
MSLKQKYNSTYKLKEILQLKCHCGKIYSILREYNGSLQSYISRLLFLQKFFNGKIRKKYIPTLPDKNFEMV